MHKLGLIRRRHQNESRQAAEIGDVERSSMSRPIGTNESGAIHSEANRQALDSDVMHHLVICALQEGRIDRSKWLEAFGGETPGKSYGMLLGDAGIEAAIGKLFREKVDAGARWHRCGDPYDLVVLTCFFDQTFAENLCVLRRIRFRFCLSTGSDVEFDHSMIFVRGGFRRRIAFSLLRHHMHKDWSCLG